MPISKAILDSMRGATLLAVLGASTLVGAAELLVSDPSSTSSPTPTPAPTSTPSVTPSVVTRRRTPPIRLLLPAPAPTPTQAARPANWCPPCGMG